MVYENYWKAKKLFQSRSFNKYEHWKKTAKVLGLSKEANVRLIWIIYYHTKSNENALLTARHFGVAPKTFWKWFSRFDNTNLRSLEDLSKAPKKKREREITPLQEDRIVLLKKKHIRYGKAKIAALFYTQYHETISQWRVQKVIEKHKLYYHPKKQAKINRKRARSVKRKKLTELKKKKRTGFLLQLDTIVLYINSSRRYIFTAIDRHSKLAFARMYSTKSSYNARDFLRRLNYLLDGKIENVGHDNGSEFKGYFEQECKRLNIPQYYSRIKTPKDNAVNERFNRTIQEEFVKMGNMTDNTALFNQRLIEWLVEYNFNRPHQTLGYMPPINFIYKHEKLLPMYPSSTFN